MKAARRVLVVGTGGESKYDYLRCLGRYADEIWVLDPVTRAGKRYPTGVRTRFCDFRDPTEVVKVARELHDITRFERVGTIMELCIEQAAAVRQELGLPGLKPEHACLVRDKELMATMLSGQVEFPDRQPFSGESGHSGLARAAAGLKPDWVLRPSRAAANLGVRFASTPDDLESVYNSAVQELGDNPYSEWSSTPLDDQWVLSTFVSGREFEADVLVHRGRVQFHCLQEKTIVRRGADWIEENRSVTPPELGSSESVIKSFLESVALTVFERVAEPAGEEDFVLYPEFILDSGTCCCLEVAYRIGGAFCPMAARLSTGIDMFDLAAQCTLGMRPHVQPREPTAVASQILYASVPGVLERIEALRHLPGVRIRRRAAPGQVVRTPHSEYLALIVATAASNRAASELLDRSLVDVRIVIRTPEGRLVVCRPPLRASAGDANRLGSPGDGRRSHRPDLGASPGTGYTSPS